MIKLPEVINTFNEALGIDLSEDETLLILSGVLLATCAAVSRGLRWSVVPE